MCKEPLLRGLDDRPKIIILVEPRCSDQKADNFIKHSGFDRFHRVEANGFSRVIWVLWQDCVNVVILENHRKFIHMKIEDVCHNISLLTVVYASPIPLTRRILWRELDRIINYFPMVDRGRF